MPKRGRSAIPPEWVPHFEAIKAIAEWHGKTDDAIAFVGGIAVGIHTRPRATKDVDVCLSTGLTVTKVAESMTAFGFGPAFVESVELGERNGVIPMRHRSGALVDVILARFPFQQDIVARAKPLKFSGLKIPVAVAEDLCAMKIEAGRPQDLADVTSLLAALPKLNRKSVLEAVRLYSEMIEDAEVYERAASLLLPS